MAAATSKKPCLWDVEITEASVILEGIKLAVDVALSPLLIGFDSKNVVNFILNGTSSREELDWILYDIRVMIEQNNQYQMAYTFRSYNLVAHALEKKWFFSFQHLECGSKRSQ